MWMRFSVPCRATWHILWLVWALTLPAQMWAQVRQVVAVVDVDRTTQDVGENEAVFLSEAVRRVVASTLPEAQFTMLSKEVMDILVPPDEQAACQGTMCLAEFGREFQADFVIGGTVSSFDGSLTLTLSCYETRSGELMGTSQRVGPTPSVILSDVEQMIPEVVRRLLPLPTPEPSQPHPALMVPEMKVGDASTTVQTLPPAVMAERPAITRAPLPARTRLALTLGGSAILTLGMSQVTAVQAEEAYESYLDLGAGTTQGGFDAAWNRTMRLNLITTSGRILAAGLMVGGGITWVFGD